MNATEFEKRRIQVNSDDYLAKAIVVTSWQRSLIFALSWETSASREPSSLLKLPNDLRGCRVEEKGKESRYVFARLNPF